MKQQLVTGHKNTTGNEADPLLRLPRGRHLSRIHVVIVECAVPTQHEVI